jgi:peptide/nickel transport system permease protein
MKIKYRFFHHLFIYLQIYTQRKSVGQFTTFASMFLLRKRRTIVSSNSLSRQTWKRLKKDKTATGSLIFLLLAVLIALAGYLITPDSTPYANTQLPEIAASKPGFSVMVLQLTKNEESPSVNIFSRMLFGAKSACTSIPIYKYRFENDEIVAEEYTGMNPNEGRELRYRLADVAFALAPGTEPKMANANSVRFTTIDGGFQEKSIAELQELVRSEHLQKKTFLLGTDRFGRDMLSQLLIGTRVSLSVGLISVIISLIIGILLGALAGFFRGWVDQFLMWFINVVWSIPTLLLVIAITFALGKGFWQVFIAVGLTMWVEVARVVRGQILSLREKEFVEAGKALGFRNSRIIFRHVLPNVMGPVIVISAANFASAILIEAGLSFLGIGVQPPMPSWGTMIRDHYAYIILDNAHLAVIPGLAIMLMVLAFMLVGNGLRDALDVRYVEKQ